MNIATKKRFAWLIGILACVAVYTPTSAHALTIAPARAELLLNPGETALREVTLINGIGEPSTVSLSAKEYSIANGAPQFTDGGVGSWIKMEKSDVVIQDGEIKKVLVRITVPPKTEPGTYAAVVLAEEASDAQKEGAVVQTRVGALFMVGVDGPASDKGRIIGFTEGKKWMTSLPAEFRVLYQNTGKMHVRPSGFIRIRNMWGTILAEIPWNPGSAAVMPRTTKEFTANWNVEMLGANTTEWEREWRNGPFGRYSATLFFDENGMKRQIGQVRFFVLPYQLLAFFAVLAAIAVSLLLKLRTAYNHHLTEKFERCVAKNGVNACERKFGIK